ncbi:Transcriptional activator protein [Trichinella pseudospiralis]
MPNCLVVDLTNVPREEWMGLPWEEFFSRFSKDNELKNIVSSDSESDDEHFTAPSDLANLPIMDLPPFRNFPGPKEYVLHECGLCGYYVHSSALKRHLGIRHGDTFKEIYGKNNANLNNLTEENKTDITIATALSNSEENNLNKDANEKQVKAVEEAESSDVVVKKKTQSSRDRNRKSTPRAAPSKKGKSNSGRKHKTDTSRQSDELQLQISNNDEAFTDKGKSVLESTNLAEEQLSDNSQTPAVVAAQNSNVGKKIRKAAAVHEKTAEAPATNVDAHAAVVKCDKVEPTKTRKRKKEQQRAGRRKVSTNKTTTALGNLDENEINADFRIENEAELQHSEQQSLQQQQQQEQSSEIVLQQQQQANLRPRIIKLFPSPELLSSSTAVGNSSTSSTTALASMSNNNSSTAGLEYYQVSPTYRNGVPFFAFRRISPTAANSQQQAGNIVGLQCGSLLSLAAGQIPPATNNQSNETSIVRSNAVANAENCDTTVSNMLLGLQQAATSARITSADAAAAVRRVDSLDGLQLD